MSTIRLEDMLELSVDQRMELIEMLWETIAATPDELPLTEAQRLELDRRLETHSKNPEHVESWDEVKDRVRQSK